MDPIFAELQIDAGWLLPIEPEMPLRQHSVVVNGGVITAVLPTADAAARYSAKRRVDLSNHIVLPGLVNAHCHAAMSLMRGIADDLVLEDWLQAHIWPREAAHMSADFVFDGSLLAAAEMIRGGIKRAESHQITKVEDTQNFIAKMFEIAPNFDEQAEIKAVLDEQNISPDKRIEKLQSPVISDDVWEKAKSNYKENAWFAHLPRKQSAVNKKSKLKSK